MSEVPVGTSAAPEEIGRYRVIRELGSGGQGTVYLCVPIHSVVLNPLDYGGSVAVKLVRSDTHAERIFTEARLAQLLGHPNVVRIIEYGSDAGLPYVAFEHLQESLSEQLPDGGSLPLRDAASCLLQVGSGVGRAHVLGIVHGDIKPSNVLFDHAGVAKVTDFGMARVLAHPA
ncbi:MAG: serine/threonine protein kinase [Chloroflexi bacterium]|jgi:eukaryotic-like serine/threonine-protein kinase|nr:serine/threonine protein kinase [Chloroflexota bacterium]MBT4514978.1 serine/threonine protein kinase [Chloroflexota bacterium]MBT5318946.1 serine/threonine protein kinase [Chloroflexota bacterium]MBT6681842.1 serine/threonine protein kinase [Chloroflexota bacterium]